MKHDKVQVDQRTSGMKDADRIRMVLREIWDVRESADPDRAPTLPDLWWELERLVAKELEHKLTEELTLQD
jgi:hypothetical protein